RFDSGQLHAMAHAVTGEHAVPAAAKPAAAAPAPAPAPARPAAPAPAAPAPAAAPPPAAAAATGPSVTFAKLGKVAPCPKGKSICEAAEAAHIKLDADCHQGVCGMDPVKVLSGGEFLSPMSDAEKGTLED